jgi:hypothetical protein
MKTTSFKAFLILGGLILLNVQSMNAGIVDKFENFIGNEFSSFNLQGLYLIGGIVTVALVFYILSNHFTKEEEAPIRNDMMVKPHKRHHHRSVIKKTA